MSQAQSLADIARRRARDVLADELLGGFLEQTRWLALGVPLDGAAAGRKGVASNARGLQGRAVGDGHVPGVLGDQYGAVGRSLVEFPARGVAAFGKAVLVIAASEDPGARGKATGPVGDLGDDVRDPFRHGRAQVHLAERNAEVDRVKVGIDQAGRDGRRAEVVAPRTGARCCHCVTSVSSPDDMAACHRQCRHIGAAGHGDDLACSEEQVNS